MRRLATITAAALVAIAACGGSDDATESGDTADTAPSPTADEPAATDPPADDAPTDDTAVDGENTADASADEPTDPDGRSSEESSDEEPATGEPGDPADDGDEPNGPRQVEHAFGTTEIPADPQRIAALSEEFLLADLLSLGVTPIASTSNSLDQFPGLDATATDGVELIYTPEFNIEQLAALQPDLILAYPGSIDLLPGGYDLLADIAPTVAVGERDDDWRAQLSFVAEALGRDAELDARLAEIDRAFTDAAGAIDGRSFSLLAINPGPFLRTYTTDQHRLAEVVLSLGGTLVPDDLDGTDAAGRVVLSLEQLELLQGETLVLLQTASSLEGEDDAVTEVTSSPLWPAIPAVADERVVTIDRLGYPGSDGLAQFAADLAAALDALS